MGLTGTLGRVVSFLLSTGHSPFPTVVQGRYLKEVFLLFQEIMGDSVRGDGALEELKCMSFPGLLRRQRT